MSNEVRFYMGKFKYLIPFLLSASLSGCANYEDLATKKTEDTQHKTTPERDTKPTREQRDAIMSGHKPDWSATSTDSVRVPIFRW